MNEPLPSPTLLPRLCIFARVPRRGRVKTRLAAKLGEDAALAAHVALVEDTLQRLGRISEAQSELWLDDEPDATCRRWAERFELPIRRQAHGDLGARMHGALLTSLAVAPSAMVVGTDCPLIDGAYVAAAVAALSAAEVVLGPAADGGYGLVAARRPVPQLFSGIPWGSAVVLEATLAAAQRAGIEVALLPEIWDVDTPADWQRYLRLRGSR
ncbi:MAG: TIGR04282 family arsenosugar biosynthesis glycosyltransferase [Pseudomonadales bacterium]